MLVEREHHRRGMSRGRVVAVDVVAVGMEAVGQDVAVRVIRAVARGLGRVAVFQRGPWRVNPNGPVRAGSRRVGVAVLAVVVPRLRRPRP